MSVLHSSLHSTVRRQKFLFYMIFKKTKYLHGRCAEKCIRISTQNKICIKPFILHHRHCRKSQTIFWIVESDYRLDITFTVSNSSILGQRYNFYRSTVELEIAYGVYVLISTFVFNRKYDVIFFIKTERIYSCAQDFVVSATFGICV